MKSYILLIASLFISFLTFSQKNNGYYGKRFFIDVEGLGNYPMFSNLFSNADNGYAANTTVFIPKFEFTTSKALLPMGLSHQLGFGFATSSAVEKDYLYQYTNYQFTSPIVNYSTYTNDIDPINFDKSQNVKKFVLLYALNMRTPITKSLMINYGIKYTINIGKKPNDYYYAYSGGDPTLNYTKYVENSMARHRGFSFMNAFVGLTFVF